MTRTPYAVTVALALAACATAYDPLDEYEEVTPATVMEAPAPEVTAARDPAQAAHGKYLVELLGCGSCHTDGALIGEPDPTRLLAGSSVGIAYSNPLKEDKPGIVYPPNLTADPGTGVGRLSDAQLLQAIRGGTDRHGVRRLLVMPWPGYAKLSDSDAGAIVAYLRSLPPVVHAVPENVRPGQAAAAPYVHFGIYRSRD